MVDMGVEMFLPMSQVDIQKVKNPNKMLGKDYWFKVVKLNKKEKSGTVSRRVLLEDEKQEKLKTLLGSLEVGQLVKGVVTSIVDYGAFVDLGGLEGLVHKDNISYGRINHPGKTAQGRRDRGEGAEIDREKGKISWASSSSPILDRHQETNYPWASAWSPRWSRSSASAPSSDWRKGSRADISDLTGKGVHAVEEYVSATSYGCR
jgi:small subunit ribosomal protein S1